MMMVANSQSASPTLICIHGAGGGAWEWNVWRRVFAANGWDVRALELQPSADGIAATTLQDYVRQVADRCAQVESKCAVLAGASLGGLLALIQAARQVPAALILINPMPPAGLCPTVPPAEPSPAVIKWHRSRFESTLRAMPDADAAACWYAWRRWRDESGQVLDAARVGVELKLPACPAMLFCSSLDADVPAWRTRRLASSLGENCIELNNVSHVGPLLGRIAPVCAAQALRWVASQKFNAG